MMDQVESFNNRTSVGEVAPTAAGTLVQKTEGQSKLGTPPLHPDCASDADSIVSRSIFGILVEEVGEDAAYELLVLFVNETDSRLKMLRHLSFDADKETVLTEAHSLKSAAASFGWQHLSTLARQLECDCLNISESEYHAMLDQLQTVFERARVTATNACPFEDASDSSGQPNSTASHSIYRR